MDKDTLLAQSIAESQPGQRDTLNIPNAPKPEADAMRPSLYGIETPTGKLWGEDLTGKDVKDGIQGKPLDQAIRIEDEPITRPKIARRAQAISKRSIRDRKRNNELKRKALGAIAGIGMAVGSYFASGENQNHLPDGTPKPELRTPDGRATPALEEFLKTQRSR